ncbi:hypothetical protein [Synechococcus sp. M16CYN]|uniref:hypothetical protein n=1 Tax=Synechococcus sp. M16CYN TaxID=3103139 RepID=UPI00333F4C23
MRASAACGSWALSFNMSICQSLSVQHERRRLHLSAEPERRIERRSYGFKRRCWQYHQ